MNLQFPFFWPGERLGVPAIGLRSRVMGVASRSRTAFPPAEVSLERDVTLPVSSQRAPPSPRVLNVDGSSCAIDEPVLSWGRVTSSPTRLVSALPSSLSSSRWWKMIRASFGRCRSFGRAVELLCCCRERFGQKPELVRWRGRPPVRRFGLRASIW